MLISVELTYIRVYVLYVACSVIQIILYNRVLDAMTQLLTLNI